MKRYDVIKLLADDKDDARGVFDDPYGGVREVMCEVRSVSMSAFFQAYSEGLNLSYVFVLSQPEEYKGEKVVEYKNEKYNVVRTYINKGDAIELSVERERFQ